MEDTAILTRGGRPKTLGVPPEDDPSPMPGDAPALEVLGWVTFPRKSTFEVRVVIEPRDNSKSGFTAVANIQGVHGEGATVAEAIQSLERAARAALTEAVAADKPVPTCEVPVGQGGLVRWITVDLREPLPPDALRFLLEHPIQTPDNQQ